MRIWGFFLLILNIYAVNAQNLIVNPGAELDPLTNGWSEGVVAAPINNAHWTYSNFINFGEVNPHSGNYHFYAGDNSNGNYYLYQDVDVSAYAAFIDVGTCSFTFSFWTRMYNYSGFTANDAAKALVEYRDGVGTVLSTYDSGWKTQLFWTQYSDTRNAPPGTRTIHVRLQTNRTSGTAADGYFDDLSLTTPVTLPVSLLTFEAVPLDKFISIRWQTSSENNNAYFTLEKSVDGEHWETLSRQDGALQSYTIRSYSFADINPAEGPNYYRLSQTDINGTKVSFEIISCNYLHSEPVIQIYPNPCPQGEPLHITAPENCLIQLYSGNGTLIYSGNKETFHTEPLIPGVYYFLIRGTEENYSEKVVVE